MATRNHLQKLVLIICACCLFVSCATTKLGSQGQAKVHGKTYVIIGASSGFGRGVAEELGAYGANVVLAARRTNLLEEVAANVTQKRSPQRMDTTTNDHALVCYCFSMRL
jgi:5,10-methylene-tetrahydrofolate dehydrogenase/methenyl tetrahydrofolate cyclohydrolase